MLRWEDDDGKGGTEGLVDYEMCLGSIGWLVQNPLCSGVVSESRIGSRQTAY